MAAAVAMAPRGAAGAAPDVAVTPLPDGRLSLSWPHADPGYVLQESDSPGGLALWRGLPDAPAVNGLQRTVVRTLPAGTLRAFYRLRSRGVFAGLDYLAATQSSDGAWSGGPGCRDTAEALTALALYGEYATALGNGVAGLGGLPVRNHDDGARKLLALAAAGGLTGPLAAELLAGQDVEIGDAAALAYPGRGWGLADGFGSSTIDSALVLRALRAAGHGGGLALHQITVPAGGMAAPIPFTVPAGAGDQLLKVRLVTGATLRFSFSLPGGGASFVDVAPRTTVLEVFFPEQSGAWSLTVQNLGGVAATYSAEFGYTTAAGFDTFRLTTPLCFLAGTQNADGGWGIGRGEDRHLMITTEVLRALAGWAGVFQGPTVLNGGANWLRGRQNGDGGFSTLANASNAHETSLAMLALKAADPAGALTTAAAWLKAAQAPDGSWGQSVAVTALAVQALRLGPTVGPIPGQSVAAPLAFAPINLDNFAADPDHADNQLNWSVTGNALLSVAINASRVAAITYPADTALTETLTFTATDPDGFSGSASATFTVSLADYSIGRGGSVDDQRTFTGPPAELAETAFYTETLRTVPANVTYQTTGVAIGGDTVTIDFRIIVGAAAVPGIYTFEAEYGLLNAASEPLGPLTGNVFTFRLQITP